MVEYGNNERLGVSPAGLQRLSSTNGLITGYGTEMRYAQGSLHASTGIVVDPEGSRRVGQFVNLADFADLSRFKSARGA